MWSPPSIQLVLIFLLAIFSPVVTVAQPGDESRLVEREMTVVQAKIADASQQITNDPLNAKLYAKRGSLFVELYQTGYENHLRYGYRNTTLELNPAVIATKAISDLDKAIEKIPSTDLYLKRGEMFEVRWSEIARVVSVNSQKTRQWPSESWEHVAEKPLDELQLAVLVKLLTIRDFSSAVNDYTSALTLNKDPELSKVIHTKFARLYLGRGLAIPDELPAVWKMINQKNRYHYTIWADFDRAVEHLSKGTAFRSTYSRTSDWFRLHEVSILQISYLKGWIAYTNSKYDMALRAFNLAVEHLDNNERGDLPCDLYLVRSRTNTRLGNLDAAIKDASTVIPQSKKICPGANEPRGDAYFGKGNWRAAIDDYTTAIKACTVICLPKAHRNRAISYAHLGETEKAIADLTLSSDSCHGECAREDYLLRAQLYRKIGQVTLALADERFANKIRENIRPKKAERLVYGQLNLPDGIPINRQNFSVRVIDVADQSKVFWSSVDWRSRFKFSYPIGRTVRLIAYYRFRKDETLVRLFKETGRFRINRDIGPLVITIDQIAPDQ